ncbi:MAG TPA: hypothetical protein ENF51_00005 [Candidatus Aenigmarchaeota archaeon]|nr:hypothetical protein [Candidatus Aenigmarchaeota archaeon]
MSYVEKLILDMFGKEALQVVKTLMRTGRIDEFSLAEKLKKDVNKVRSILYSLYEKKVVEYDRERDEKRAWWVYFWRVNVDRIRELWVKRHEEEIKRLEEKKEKLSANQLFECKDCKKVFTFEVAAKHDFSCPVCGSPLEAVDSSFIINEIEEKIKALKEEVKKVITSEK